MEYRAYEVLNGTYSRLFFEFLHEVYDEAIAHIANKRIKIDLDDGVKVNYEKFQG